LDHQNNYRTLKLNWWQCCK